MHQLNHFFTILFIHRNQSIMNKHLLLNLLIVFLAVNLSYSQDIRKIGVPELEKILSNNEDQLNILNFWATWCGPCVTELPYFQEASLEFSDQEIKILLISLDFPSQVESRLLPFLEEKKIDLDVVLMNELDYNKWISKVDSSWKGNLPATLVFNNVSGVREFVPGAVDKEELFTLIKNNLN